MNKYYLKIYLRSSNIVKGKYIGNEKDTDEVAERIFIRECNEVIGVESITGSILFFRIGEVEAFEISVNEID